MKALKGFNSVYCDASFFVALFSKKDSKHKRALELFHEIKEFRILIYTSWFIISEAMTVLLYRYGYLETLAFNQSIALYRILISSESQHRQAIALFNLFARDRKISSVDALSYILIKDMPAGIPAISFDEDFKALGLTTIS
jgi:predicted nucleic acid-binding protein